MRPRDRGFVPHFALATYALVAIDVAVFAHEVALAPGARESFVDAYALVPFDLTHGVQIVGAGPPTALTLVTAQFLHGSVLHIFFNMAFLLVFGPEIECEFGHVRFVAFYLVCGVLGGLAEVSVTTGSHVPGIGASGAIAGVLGAYLVRFPLREIARIPAFVLVGLWASVQVVHGFGSLSDRVLSETGGGTAYFAHIGGLLAGVFLATLARGTASPRSDRNR